MTDVTRTEVVTTDADVHHDEGSSRSQDQSDSTAQGYTQKQGENNGRTNVNLKKISIIIKISFIRELIGLELMNLMSKTEGRALPNSRTHANGNNKRLRALQLNTVITQDLAYIHFSNK